MAQEGGRSGGVISFSLHNEKRGVRSCLVDVCINVKIIYLFTCFAMLICIDDKQFVSHGEVYEDDNMPQDAVCTQKLLSHSAGSDSMSTSFLMLFVRQTTSTCTLVLVGHLREGSLIMLLPVETKFPNFLTIFT